MNDQQLLAVLDDLTEGEGDERSIDRSVDRSIDELLTVLAGSIAARSGTGRVEVACAGIESGEHQPQPSARVYFGSTHPPASPPRTLERLSLLGEHPILGDLTPVACRRKDPEGAGRPTHLLVRVRTPHFLGWVTVELRSQAADTEAWGRASARLLRAVGKIVDFRSVSSPRVLRRQFFESLLEVEHEEVENDLCRACACWRRAAGADGAMLWVYNATAQAYELAGYDVIWSNRQDPKPEFLELRRTPTGNGLGHLASRRRLPVLVPDVQSWAEREDGVTYEVLLKRQLAENGCRALACVPLLERRDTKAEELLDVVTLHYCHRPLELAQPRESLLTMGLVTHQFLGTTLEAQRRRVQAQLGGLTQKHLTRNDALPRTIRDEYLKELIALIQRELHVDGVSIFFRSQHDWVTCLASTGLADERGRPVAPSQYASVIYRPNEGWTGECFATNRPILFPAPERDEAAHQPRYTEIRQESPPDGEQPVLLQPLPADSASPDAPGGAIGVIRCIGHRSKLFQNHYTQFRPAGMALLRAIALDVSPILQTLNLRVEREQTVSVIKHEVKTPLGMILDTAHLLLDNLAAGKPIREVDLRDIEVSANLAMNLAQQLGMDALTLRTPRSASVLLEGDIVARLRSMLSHFARGSNGMSIRFGDGFRSIPALWLDRDLIEQALLNLVVNAIKYGKRGSQIEIEARPPDSNARSYIVDVINQGIGVEEEEKEKIFLPNYRSPHAMRSATPGVGLGLAIARQALRAHEGNVYLTRAKDPTIFSLYIPKALVRPK